MTAATSLLFRRDETLYSGLARLSRYLGRQPRSALHAALLDTDISVFDDMPVGLERVVASGVAGSMTVGDVAGELTLFQYYAHYALPGSAYGAATAMMGEGRWPHEALGSWTSAAPPVECLRFCDICYEEMLGQHPDPWWRRSHQLPSVLVCPDHGVPLRSSTVDRDGRRRAYLAASRDTCPAEAPAVLEIDDPRVMADLLVLARQSEEVLNDRGEVDPDERREAYLQDLDQIDMLNRLGEAKLPAIARAMDAYWGSTLDLWPQLRRDGRCEQPSCWSCSRPRSATSIADTVISRAGAIKR